MLIVNNDSSGDVFCLDNNYTRSYMTGSRTASCSRVKSRGSAYSRSNISSAMHAGKSSAACQTLKHKTRQRMCIKIYVCMCVYMRMRDVSYLLALLERPYKVEHARLYGEESGDGAAAQHAVGAVHTQQTLLLQQLP